MFPTSWRKWIKRLPFTSLTSRVRARNTSRQRLQLEHLEVRLAPAIRSWTGLGADNLWKDAANWKGSVAPVAGDDLVFGTNTLQHANVNNFDPATVFHSVTLSAGGYALTGNAITLGDPNTGIGTFTD